jgi:thioredoxin 1
MKGHMMKKLALAMLVAAIAVSAPAWGAATKSTAKKADPKAPPATQALPKFLDLGSTTCIPCKMMVPVMDQLKKEYSGQIEVQFINVKTDSAAVKKYGIQSIPTQIIFDAKGKEVWRHLGYIPKEDILKAFKDKGIKLNKPANPKKPASKK